MNIKTQVIAQINIEGFHSYPNAPKEVSFLENNHRHTFKIKVFYSVTDLNREREIFLCRDEVRDYINESFGVPANFENMSCEMIAKEIIEFAIEDGCFKCEVWEEETGGAIVELDNLNQEQIVTHKL